MITQWQDELESTLRSASPQEFAQSIADLYRSSNSIPDFIAQTSSLISWSLYQDEYPGSIPNSYPSFISAVQLGQYVQPLFHFRALAQSLWFCFQESRPVPFDPARKPVPEPKERDSIRSQLERYRKEKNFEDFFSWATALFQDESERQSLIAELLQFSAGDLFNMGHRYLYLSKTFALLDYLRWQEPETIIFPAMHYFLFAPEDRWAEELIAQRLEYHRLELMNRSYDSYQLSSDQILQIRDAVLYDTREGVLDTLLGAIDYGVHPSALIEALMVTAAQLVLAIPYDRWLFPVHGFNSMETYFSSLDYHEPVDQQRLVLIAGLHLKQVAESAAPFRVQEPFFTERPEEARPTPTDLEEAIDLSIPQDAMAIVDWNYHYGQLDPRFFERLALEAAKTDGDRHFGHDMIFTHSAIHAFHCSSSPLRHYYLLALVKFLAESEKIREIDHALAQVLRS